MRNPFEVLVAIQVDAGTVRRGDQVMIGGQVFTVADMVSLGLDRKRLDFTTGESFVMRRTTALAATRRVSRRRNRFTDW